MIGEEDGWSVFVSGCMKEQRNYDRDFPHIFAQNPSGVIQMKKHGNISFFTDVHVELTNKQRENYSFATKIRLIIC